MKLPENSKTWDVIIIGAGPAGLRAAKVLADAKKQVLLIEKQKTACNKVCAEGITAKILNLDYFPRECIVKQFHTIKIVIGKKETPLSEQKPVLCAINRPKMGEQLVAQARTAGAEILFNTRAETVTTKNNLVFLNTQKGEMKCKNLIGAEGFKSPTRKFLGIKRKECGYAFELRIPREMPDIEIHLNPKLFGPLYGWVFPNSGFTSIGAGSFSDTFNSNQLKTNLFNFCKTKDINLTGAKLRSAGMNADFKGWHFGNVYLAGEAAGFVQDLTGEGIYNALISGEEIANKILNPAIKTPEIDDIIKSKQDQHKIISLYRFSPMLIKTLYAILPPLLRYSKKFRKRALKAVIH